MAAADLESLRQLLPVAQAALGAAAEALLAGASGKSLQLAVQSAARERRKDTPQCPA